MTGYWTTMLSLICVVPGYSTIAKDCDLELVRNLLHPSVYDVSLRPDQKNTVRVFMKAALFQILELDERKQEIHLNMWFTFVWIDSHFLWTPGEYCGIEFITVQPLRIWMPDIVLVNSVSEENRAQWIFAQTPVVISHNGTVTWPTLALIRATCRVEIRKFPFDRQECDMVFASWTDDITKLLLTSNNMSADLSSYVESGEWTLHGVPSVSRLRETGIGGAIYTEVVFTVMIERKPLFFMFNMVMPCLMLMAVGVLAFFLPPDTGEKIALCTTVLLTLVLFQIMLSDFLPPTSDVIPLLTQFIATAVALLVVSTGAAVFVVTLYHKALRQNPVPQRLLKISFKLAKLLCLSGYIFALECVTPETTSMIENDTSDQPKQNNNQDVEEHEKASHLFDAKWDTRKTSNLSTRPAAEQEKAQQCTPEEHVSHYTAADPAYLDDAAASLGMASRRYLSLEKNRSNFRRIRAEWCLVAGVIDRSLMLLVTIAAIIITVAIFLSASS